MTEWPEPTRVTFVRGERRPNMTTEAWLSELLAPRADEAYRNWLKWASQPGVHSNMSRPVPPAFYAYQHKLTTWCPPLGEW